MTDSYWSDEYVRIGTLFATGKITEEEFHREMRRLGFDPNEIIDQMNALLGLEP